MSTFTELIDRNRIGRARRRKSTNALMLSLTALLTVLALVPLFWIIGYVVIRGGKSINLDFFIHLPRPMGMAGGGVLHAIEGTLVVTLLAAVFAIPPGVLAAFYAARFPNTPLGVALRFSTDVLSGVPSIVIGLFTLCPDGQTDGTLFRAGRRCGPGFPDAADHHPHNRRDAQTGAFHAA